MEKGNINLKKWESIKFLSLLMLYAIFFSCRSHEVALHYYNGLNSDKNHTWSSSLQIFFEKDE